MFLSQVEDVKQRFGYIAYDHDAELERSATDNNFGKHYELPYASGNLFVGSLQFRCTEPLFQPQLLNDIGIDIGEKGIHEFVYETVLKCDSDIRLELLSNIVVCGGNAKFKGMEKRLNKELQKVLFGRNVIEMFLNVMQRENDIEDPISMDIVHLICKYEGVAKYERLCDDCLTVNVIVGTNDHFDTVWSGGSSMAMDKTFESRWMTKDEYWENGPSVVHQK